MAQIYRVESCSPMEQKQLQQGIITTQNCVLRELEGEPTYCKKYAVDNLSGQDLTEAVGKLVVTHIAQRFSESNGRAWSNFVIREVYAI